MKRIKLFLIPVILITTIYIFSVKPEWLLIAIGDSFPSGTLISWLLIVAWAFLFYSISKKKWVKKILFVNFLLGLFWGLVGYLISGNWGFNFTGGKFYYLWISFTAIVVLSPLLVLLLSGLIKLFGKK